MASSPAVSVPIIDTHVHLYPQSEVETHQWYAEDNPLAKQHSIQEYRTATGAPGNLQGFVLIEVDRKNDNAKDWTHPLQEIAWLRRIVTGQPNPGEGHTAEDGRDCLGIVPWAPVVLGSAELEKYLAAAEKEAGPETWAKVKGFRYLLQDKPNGTALSDDFIEGLKLLGRKKFVFDLGVDQHKRGRIQLEEAVEMIDRAHEGVDEEDKVVFILNHLCKPDLTIVNVQTDPSYIAWRTAMFTLSKCDRTYMKLSGCFSEMPEFLRLRPAEEILSAILPWLAVVIAAFGPERIMFGSDWPVCTLGIGEEGWKKWRRVVEMTCHMAGLGPEAQTRLWAETAREAYKLDSRPVYKVVDLTRSDE